jgi:GT2 family glycosyltransferase
VNSSALVRRAAFAQSGGLDEDPGLIGVEDYNLWLRLLAAGWTILSVPEELCIYTRLSSGLSRQTIRFASAALANIAKLARQLELDPRLVRLKEISTYDEFALDFFAQRDMKNARVFFTESLRRQFSFKQLGWLGLTYAPKRFLDWRRALLSRSANKGITGATIQNSK